MRYIALERLRWGDGWIEPGEPVPSDETGPNYALAVEHGQIMVELDPPSRQSAQTKKKGTP